MKTALIDVYSVIKYGQLSKGQCVDIVRNYARQVAQDALDRAAERVTSGQGILITSTEIVTP